MQPPAEYVKPINPCNSGFPEQPGLLFNKPSFSPSKTQAYNNPIHLKISMDAALREVVGEYQRSSLVSPYLIHYKPKSRQRE